MTQVGVKALKDALSEYLRRVGEGEQIVITDRGHPIALLAPVAQDAVTRAAWTLVAAGRASWSGGKPRGAEHPPRLEGNRAAAIVLEDRR
jgi:prevent-host-death family protein